MYIFSYLLANGKHNIQPKSAFNEYTNDLLLIPVTTGEQTVVNSDSLLLVHLVEYISGALYSAW
jgi:hypothetical protein